MPDLSTCSILVVDDTEEIIDILVEYLGSSYNVMVAMDGENALEIISSEKPDLILLDILMPGLDGYTVCKRIKDNPKTRDIPVIFLTSLSDTQDEKMGLQLGAIDYITKPLNQALVQARVKNQLELKMHRDHLETLVHQRTAELELTQEV
ncbi:MAG: response regulator, partial [Spirochaetaceae bacterium]|nr:response regulator [Spirochaetaceae bacterium]